MVRRVAFGLALLSVSALAWAWQEPTGFRGVPWGASEQELLRLGSGITCRGTDDLLLPPRYCTGELLMREIGSSLFMTFRFRYGGLVSVEVDFKPALFQGMRAALVDLYGLPTGERNEPKRTPGGLLYMNEVVVWAGSRVQMHIEKYSVDYWSEGKAVIILTEEVIRRLR